MTSDAGATPRLVTIGVHGFDATSFLDGLDRAEVDVLVDVRQRRGVRGPQYAWANATRLQVLLADADVGYLHVRELAPTTELRQLQYAADDRQGVGKRSRSTLDDEYVRRFTSEVLGAADLRPIIDELDRGRTPALLCVESEPAACHRSLVAARVASRTGVELVHVRPDTTEPPRTRPSATRASPRPVPSATERR